MEDLRVLTVQHLDGHNRWTARNRSRGGNIGKWRHYALERLAGRPMTALCFNCHALADLYGNDFRRRSSRGYQRVPQAPAAVQLLLWTRAG